MTSVRKFVNICKFLTIFIKFEMKQEVDSKDTMMIMLKLVIRQRYATHAGHSITWVKTGQP